MFFKQQTIILYIGILFLLFPKPAYAYIDPGAGSYFFQLLIAGLLGSLFFIKTIIRRARKLFDGKKQQKKKKDDEFK